MNFRPERMAKLMREQLSSIVTREVEFPDMLVTITQVEIDNKLEMAKVRVSVFPSKDEKKAFALLEHAQGRLRHLLMKKVSMKHFPQLMFVPDRGPETAANTEKAFMQLEKESGEVDKGGQTP